MIDNLELRRKAESLLNSMSETAEDLSGMSPQDIARLLHELRVHQIELKAQNDELRRIHTELETAKNRYTHLYNFAPVGYFSLDEQGTIREANLTAATLLEKQRSTLVGLQFSRFIRSEDQDAWYLHRKQLLESGEFQSFQFKLVKNDGSPFWANLECMPVRDADSDLNQIRIAVVDISELKSAEKTLRQFNENLEQRVAERTELAEARAKQLQALAVELIEAEERERQRVANLLHDDLQQILAAARFQLQGARTSLPAEPMLTHVEHLLEQSIEKSRRLSHELSPPVLHHSGLVAALQWLARQMHEQFGMQVEVQSKNDCPFENETLKVFLFRAVQELLFNAVKHAGVKSAHISISRSDEGIVLTVSDQGKGFDPENIHLSNEMAGFGLLSIRERASHIGGSLAIDSVPGQGSWLTLKVPFKPACVDAPQLIEPAAGGRDRAATEPSNSPNKTRIRVLFADDHKVMRQGLIKLITGQPGIQVVGEASNGREALEKARQLRPDIVVMDVSMPEMDGVEATRLIKIELPEVRVIGLSMYEDDHIVRTMHEAGAESFLSKTTSTAELLKAIYGSRPAAPHSGRQDLSE